MILKTTLLGKTYGFSSLKEVLAKANEEKTGDKLAGLAAQSAQERIAAKVVLSAVTLGDLRENPAVPYEADEVTRIIQDDVNETVYNKIRNWTVSDLREWILSETTTGDDIRKLSRGLTAEMIAAVCKLMGNLDLIYAANKITVTAHCNTTIGLPGTLSCRLQPNHTTDDPEGITASTLEGLSFGAGDAVIGLNPVTTSAEPANFCLKMGDAVILDENYVPDSSGRVVIYDLQKLIEPYLLTNLIETFTYTITDGDASPKTRSFTVQYCAAESSLSARSFMEQYFLSSLMGDKVTTLGRKEFLHLVTTEACSVSAICTYWADGVLTVGTVLVKEVTELNKVVTFEVSPSLFEEVGKLLVKYEIQAGQRRQLYLVDDAALDVAPALLFTNSFGCQETFYCTGTQEIDPQFSRSASLIGGKYRNYLIEENRVFSANTGVLNVAMSMWADELFRSREIYLLVNNLPDKEITITESDSKRSNDYEAMYVYTFKYRYAQRNHNILHLPKAGRVFDFTFDNTFE